MRVFVLNVNWFIHLNVLSSREALHEINGKVFLSKHLLKAREEDSRWLNSSCNQLKAIKNPFIKFPLEEFFQAVQLPMWCIRCISSSDDKRRFMFQHKTFSFFIEFSFFFLQLKNLEMARKIAAARIRRRWRCAATYEQLFMATWEWMKFLQLCLAGFSCMSLHAISIFPNPV